MIVHRRCNPSNPTLFQPQQSMSGDVEEVRTIIALLAVKINESPAVLDPVSLSSAVNGLRNFKDNFIEVRALLSTLAEKINCMREKELPSKILSNVLYGFRHMTGESPECRQVLSALNAKMGEETYFQHIFSMHLIIHPFNIPSQYTLSTHLPSQYNHPLHTHHLLTHPLHTHHPLTHPLHTHHLLTHPLHTHHLLTHQGQASPTAPCVSGAP